MTRRPRPWLTGITPAGLIVTGTLGVCTVLATLATLVDFVRRGELDPAASALVLGLSNATTALLARSRPDPVASVEAPASVTATTDPQE